MRALSFVLIVAAGVWVMMVTVPPSIWPGYRSASFWGTPLVTILELYAAMLIVIVVHEAGHLTAGLLSGFRLLFFIAGPLRVERRQDRLRVKLGKTFGYSGGGMVGLVPVGTDHLLRRAFILTASGLFANLLLGGAAAYLFTRLDPSNGWLRFFTGMVASISLITAFLNLLPFESSHLPTDGKRILLYLKGGPQAKCLIGQLAVAAASYSGIRPRDWDPELVNLALACSDGSATEVAGKLVAYYHSIDRNDVERAEAYIRRVTALHEQYPLHNRAVIYLEAAFYEAFYRADPEAARGWLERAGDGLLLESYSRLIVEAAIHLAEGAFGWALVTAQTAEAALPTASDSGMMQSARDLVERLIQKAEAHERPVKPAA